MSTPKLGYWNIRGLAQSVRLALAYMEVNYEDVIYPDKEGDESWNNVKPTLGLESPNLPYWIDDKEKLTESKAILKYVVRKYNSALLPTDISKLVKIEQVEGLLQDIDLNFAMSVYTDTEMANNMFQTRVPGKLESISKFLGTNKFLLGNEPTYVDFLLYETLHRLSTYRPKYLEGHANLSQFVESFEKLPEIAKYMSSPAFIKAPCYSRHAVKQI